MAGISRDREGSILPVGDGRLVASTSAACLSDLVSSVVVGLGAIRGTLRVGTSVRRHPDADDTRPSSGPSEATQCEHGEC